MSRGAPGGCETAQLCRELKIEQQDLTATGSASTHVGRQSIGAILYIQVSLSCCRADTSPEHGNPGKLKVVLKSLMKSKAI
jgi:hypothetical protein